MKKNAYILFLQQDQLKELYKYRMFLVQAFIFIHDHVWLVYSLD